MNMNDFFSKKIIAAVIILLMTLAIHHALIKNVKDSTLPFSPKPDPYYIMSVIEWNMYAMQNELPALYHLNYFYPNGYVTFYGHPLFGISTVFLAAHKILGLNLYRSYVLFLLLAFFLGAFGTYLFARELSRRPIIPYFAALIFIIFPQTRNTFAHLNVFAFFWVGFVCYFLTRFQKEGRWQDALLAGFFTFLQGFFSVYHGFFLIGFLLPVFFIAAIAFRTIGLKNILKLAAAFFLFIILLMIVFSPFLTTIKHSHLYRSFHYTSLVEVKVLFKSASQLYEKLNASGFHAFFPGFSVLFLFTAALTGIKTRKQQLLILILTLLSAAVFVLNLKNISLAANWLFFALFVMYVIIFIRRRKSFSPGIKTFFAVIFIYFLVFYKFSALIPGINFSICGLIVHFVPSLSGFRFLFRSMLLLIPVFAALSAYGLSEILALQGKKKNIVSAVLFLLVIIENGYLTIPGSRLEFQQEKYNRIEKANDRVILELPFYGKKRMKNNRYTINTVFHHNYYVNGRVAFHAFKEDLVIEKKVSGKDFPNEHILRWLLRNYSVDYLIFNWNEEISKDKERIIKKIGALNKWCKILDNTPRFLVIRVKENFPVKSIKRRYSLFHVQRRKALLDFAKPYAGKISISFRGKEDGRARIVRSGASRVMISFPRFKPDYSRDLEGIPVEIIFEKPIAIKDLRLVE